MVFPNLIFILDLVDERYVGVGRKEVIANWSGGAMVVDNDDAMSRQGGS